MTQSLLNKVVKLNLHFKIGARSNSLTVGNKSTNKGLDG
jgi:hypothetical protein